MAVHMDKVNVELKAARLKAGVSLQRMSELTGVSMESLHDREEGRYPFSIAMISYYCAFIEDVDIYITIHKPILTFKDKILRWLS